MIGRYAGNSILMSALAHGLPEELPCREKFTGLPQNHFWFSKSKRPPPFKDGEGLLNTNPVFFQLNSGMFSGWMSSARWPNSTCLGVNGENSMSCSAVFSPRYSFNAGAEASKTQIHLDRSAVRSTSQFRVHAVCSAKHTALRLGAWCTAADFVCFLVSPRVRDRSVCQTCDEVFSRHL